LFRDLSALRLVIRYEKESFEDIDPGKAVVIGIGENHGRVGRAGETPHGMGVLQRCRLGFRQVAYAHRLGRIGAIRGSFRMIFRHIADSEFEALIRTADLFKRLATHALSSVAGRFVRR
jgi:hypothetical protein